MDVIEVDGEQVAREMLALEAEAVAGEAAPGPGATGGNLPGPVAADAEYRELLLQILGPGFAVIAPNWGVTGDEVEALADAYAALLAKYFPDGPGAVGPEIGAVFVTVAILGPKLRQPRQIQQSEQGAENGG